MIASASGQSGHLANACSIRLDMASTLAIALTTVSMHSSLVDEPVPNANLAGVACPNFNEDDVSWLSVVEDSQIALSDYCGCEFGPDDHQ
jgi:hypothetical protein